MMLIDLDKYAICHSQAYNYAILKAYLCPDSFSFSEGIVSTLGFHLFAYIKDKNKHNFIKKIHILKYLFNSSSSYLW